MHSTTMMLAWSVRSLPTATVQWCASTVAMIALLPLPQDSPLRNRQGSRQGSPLRSRQGSPRCSHLPRACQATTSTTPSRLVWRVRPALTRQYRMQRSALPVPLARTRAEELRTVPVCANRATSARTPALAPRHAPIALVGASPPSTAAAAPCARRASTHS